MLYIALRSKDPNNRVLGPKCYSYYSIWALKPRYLGAWTLRVDLCPKLRRVFGRGRQMGNLPVTDTLGGCSLPSSELAGIQREALYGGLSFQQWAVLIGFHFSFGNCVLVYRWQAARPLKNLHGMHNLGRTH